MNRNNSCNNLDAYLSDDLSGNERANFESHLEECATCRDTVAQQQWIDGLLQSRESVQLERPSATILDSFRISVAQRRRRVMQVACGLAVAATLLIAVGLITLTRHANGPLKSEDIAVAATETSHVPPPEQFPATFDSSSDAIAVPLESTSTDVTIVRLYPTTDAERRWRLEQSLLSASTEPNGG